MSGDFYFMKDNFYFDFANKGLMPNKENYGNSGNRPCFFSFRDDNNADLYWFVPISSKQEKYKAIYDKNVCKYGKCDFLEFGVVLGTNAAFLIQNMFPTTKEYIDSQYFVNGRSVRCDNVTTATVIQKAKTVLQKSKKGIKLTFTDIDGIYKKLTAKGN